MDESNRESLRRYFSSLETEEAKDILELLYEEQSPLFDTLDFKQDLFIAHYVAERGHVAKALRKCGLSPTRWYEWQRDAVFRAKLRLAASSTITSLRDVALQKALNGDNEMLKFLLSAEDPEKYDTKVRAQRCANEGQLDALEATARTFSTDELRSLIANDPAQQYQTKLGPKAE